MNTLLRRAALGAAGFVWFALVFLISLRLTFPADALAQWARYRIQDGSGGAQILQVGELRPWWFGLAGTDVALYSRPKGHAHESEAPLLVFAADALRARVGLLGLVRLVTGGNTTIQGAATVAGGDLDFSATIARTAEETAFRALRITGDGFPLNAVPAIAGGKLEGTGGLNLDIDLDAADGLAKSNGHATISAKDLVVEKIAAPGTLMEDLELGPIRVSEVDLAFDVTSGKAKVSRGSIVSDLLKMDIEGDIVLADDPLQSRVRLKLILSLGEGMQLFEAFLKGSEWEDGRYHYGLSGTLANPRFRAERERRSRAATNDANLGATEVPAIDRPGIDRAIRSPISDLGKPPQAPGGDDADRDEKRRSTMAARRERLAQRRRDMGMAPHERPIRSDAPELLPEDFPPIDTMDAPSPGIEEPNFPEPDYPAPDLEYGE